MTLYVVLDNASSKLKEDEIWRQLDQSVAASAGPYFVFTDGSAVTSQTPSMYFRYSDTGWEDVTYINGHMQWQRAVPQSKFSDLYSKNRLKNYAPNQNQLSIFNSMLGQIQLAPNKAPVPPSNETHPQQPLPKTEPKQPVPPSGEQKPQQPPQQPQPKPLPQQHPGRMHPGNMTEKDYTTDEFVEAINQLQSDGQQPFAQEHLAKIMPPAKDVSYLIDLINKLIAAKATNLNAINIAKFLAGSITDNSILPKVLNGVPHDQWANIFTAEQISKAVPTPTVFGQTLAALPTTSWESFLSLPGAMSSVTGVGALSDIFGQFKEPHVTSGANKGKPEDVIKMPEIITLIKTVDDLVIVIAGMAAGGWSSLLSVPSIVRLITDAASIGKILSAAAPGDWEPLLKHGSILPKLKTQDYTGISELLKQLPLAKRSGVLLLAPIKELMTSLNANQDSLSKVGALLHVLPTPPDNAWADMIKNLGLKGTGPDLGKMLSGLPLAHWHKPYIATLLNLPDITSLIEEKMLEALLSALQPAQRTAFLANCTVAKDIYTNLVANNQHTSIWKLMDMASCTPENKKILFEATLSGYAQHNQRAHRSRLSIFNKLGNAKTTLVKDVLAKVSEPTSTFDTLYDAVDQQHNVLAGKANKNWFLSNRWQLRIGNKFGETQKAPWNENVDSNLGKIMTKFRKP